MRACGYVQLISASGKRRGSWSFPSGQRATSSTGKRSTICTWIGSRTENAVHLRDDQPLDHSAWPFFTDHLCAMTPPQ